MRTTHPQPPPDSRTWTLYPNATPTGERGATPGTLSQPSPEPERMLEERLADERPTVLIVEDESSIADLIRDVLEPAGYRAVIARNGRTALALARGERPAVALTDLMMPEVDGAEFVRHMRASAATSGIPVVMMSSVRPALAMPGDGDASARRPDQRVLRALPQGQYTRVGDEVIPFLAKPFDIDDLVDVVDALVRATRGGGEAKRSDVH